jgi:hypothetical protein
MPKPSAAFKPETLAVGPPVPQHGGHSPKRASIGQNPFCIDKPGNTTHTQKASGFYRGANLRGPVTRFSLQFIIPTAPSKLLSSFKL